jgi:hypothetical protein
LRLHQSGNGNLHLHCTGHSPDFHPISYPASPVLKDVVIVEKEIEGSRVLSPPQSRFHRLPLWPSSLLPRPSHGRPNIRMTLSDVMRGTGKYDRVCVGACGLASMLDDVRTAVAAANGKGHGIGPVVDLHVESRRW